MAADQHSCERNGSRGAIARRRIFNSNERLFCRAQRGALATANCCAGAEEEGSPRMRAGCVTATPRGSRSLPGPWLRANRQWRRQRRRGILALRKQTARFSPGKTFACSPGQQTCFRPPPTPTPAAQERERDKLAPQDAKPTGPRRFKCLCGRARFQWRQWAGRRKRERSLSLTPTCEPLGLPVSERAA